MHNVSLSYCSAETAFLHILLKHNIGTLSVFSFFSFGCVEFSFSFSLFIYIYKLLHCSFHYSFLFFIFFSFTTECFYSAATTTTETKQSENDREPIRFTWCATRFILPGVALPFFFFSHLCASLHTFELRKERKEKQLLFFLCVCACLYFF